MAQRLSTAQSAYLRQHADNPVDWWPWGSAAFTEAAQRDVPVFVSIGYAACHWCHVMAHESFEDQTVARILNEKFVSIKVDREEHPEVDDAYMAATQALTGQGGWPMSVFTLPDGRVFHTGTYFPPRRMGQVPSFTEVLHAVEEAWTQRRHQVEEQAAKIADALGQQRRRQAQLATVVQTEYDDDAAGAETAAGDYTALAQKVLAALAAEEDVAHGGFGAAPKFPPSPMLRWLLEESAWALQQDRQSHDPGAEQAGSPAGTGVTAHGPRQGGAGDEAEQPAMRRPEAGTPDAVAGDRAGGLAVHTMEAMARSALFDHVEGGFARYATDRAWQLPHFEKMLYDNAQLLGSYVRLSAHPAAGPDVRDRAERTARMTIQWLRSRMLTDQGLFASSLDADTIGADGTRDEGATYLFSDEQLISAALESGLSETEAQRVAEINSGVPADEHALRAGGPLHITAETPRTLHFDQPLVDADLRLWETTLPQLQAVRSARAQPSRDDKVVAAWNAQAIQSLAEAAAVWQEPRLLEFCESVADRLWEVHAATNRAEPSHLAAGQTDEPSVGSGRVLGPANMSTKIHRTSYDGQPGSGVGTLSDHAQVASMCISLASAGADGPTWLDRAASVLRFVLDEFVSAGEGGLIVLDSLDTDGLLAHAQGGASHATPVDGPEPSSIAVLAQALQRAEAVGLSMGLPLSIKPSQDSPGQRPQGSGDTPLRPTDLLNHCQLIGPRAPLAVGGSMLVARRVAQGSPAFRLFSGRPADIAEVRRAGTLLGIPVEPVEGAVVGPDQQLKVSVCLNGEASGVCLPAADSVEGALERL